VDSFLLLCDITVVYSWGNHCMVIMWTLSASGERDRYYAFMRNVSSKGQVIVGGGEFYGVERSGNLTWSNYSMGEERSGMNISLCFHL
jgi:hypothetical protein